MRCASLYCQGAVLSTVVPDFEIEELESSGDPWFRGKV
jgi:hypothetical protein